MSPPADDARAVREAFTALLAARGPGKTLCPSEVARAVFPVEEWRGRMVFVREVGDTMVAEGLLVIRQKGEVVEPAAARGAIRYGLA